MFAFQSTWQVVALIGGVVGVRLFVSSLPRRNRQRALALELADAGLIAVLLMFCVVRPFVLQAFFIPSGSMKPSLQEQDRILVNKLVYYFRPARPGEIVVFRAPPAAAWDRREFIKRCVGGPGDEVQIKNHQLYRNGAAVDEPYVIPPLEANWPFDGRPVKVPDGMLLVFGDNRPTSNDSRSWSCNTDYGTEAAPFVPCEDVLGKAFLVFWPPQRVRILH